MRLEPSLLDAAARALGSGNVVAVATESSFGLLADVASVHAIDTLMSMKPRGGLKGTGLVLPTVGAWDDLVQEVQPDARKLAAAFWPGPLSIVQAAAVTLDSRLPFEGTVAVRLPGPCPAADIVSTFGRPLTATSANLPGEPPLCDSEEIARVFDKQVQAGVLHIVPGSSPGGPPSTLVGFPAGEPRILRPGAVAGEAVFAALSPTAKG